jgi:hypothetical protein
MKTQRQFSAAMRPARVALLATFALLGLATESMSEEYRQQSGLSVRQAPPPAQTFRAMSPAQTPGATWQYNPPGLNRTMHGNQYNPPGLNSTSGNYPVQANPPGLTSQHQEMSMPGGIAGAGGPASSQGVPGPGGPGQGAGVGSFGSAYPVGYQGPFGLQPPYGYPPAQAARQFTCRTTHYYCQVPYTGACQCENDRRERESGMTAD